MDSVAKIAVDIDSTLYDFETPAREAFTLLAQERDDKSLLRGAYDPWTEWRSPADACGLEVWLEAIAMVHDADSILAQTPYNGAVETCQALAEEGHELLYISNRATETAEATRDWLFHWDFPLDDDVDLREATEWHGGHALKVLTTDKRPFIKDCQYLIDDRAKTVVDFIYDYDWETKVRRGAERIAAAGPNVDSPELEDYEKILGVCLDDYYRIEDLRKQLDELAGPATASLEQELQNALEVAQDMHRQDMERLSEYSQELSKAYVEANTRRAFVIAYPYNQALTDVPRLYLAPTWAGLNVYLVSKGVLSKPAYHPLGVAA
jgi:hypothetical protein